MSTSCHGNSCSMQKSLQSINIKMKQISIHQKPNRSTNCHTNTKSIVYNHPTRLSNLHPQKNIFYDSVSKSQKPKQCNNVSRKPQFIKVQNKNPITTTIPSCSSPQTAAKIINIHNYATNNPMRNQRVKNTHWHQQGYQKERVHHSTTVQVRTKFNNSVQAPRNCVHAKENAGTPTPPVCVLQKNVVVCKVYNRK